MSARRRESAEPFVSESTADIIRSADSRLRGLMVSASVGVNHDSSESTADTIRSLDFVQGHPCVSCRTVRIVGVVNHGCPGTKSPERQPVGVDG
jgi:hypothetical protein